MANTALTIPQVIYQDPPKGDDQTAQYQKMVNDTFAKRAANKNTAYSKMLQSINLPYEPMWDTKKSEQLMSGRSKFYNTVVDLYKSGADPTDMRTEANRAGFSSVQEMLNRFKYQQKRYDYMGKTHTDRYKMLMADMAKQDEDKVFNYEESKANLDKFKGASFEEAEAMMDKGLLVPNQRMPDLYKKTLEGWNTLMSEDVTRIIQDLERNGEEVTEENIRNYIPKSRVEDFVRNKYYSQQGYKEAIEKWRERDDPNYVENDPETRTEDQNVGYVVDGFTDQLLNSVKFVRKPATGTDKKDKSTILNKDKDTGLYNLAPNEYKSRDKTTGVTGKTVSGMSIPLSEFKTAASDWTISDSAKNKTTGRPAFNRGESKTVKWTSIEFLPKATEDFTNSEGVEIKAGDTLFGTTAKEASAQGLIEFQPTVTYANPWGRGRTETVEEPLTETLWNQISTGSDLPFDMEDIDAASKQIEDTFVDDNIFDWTDEELEEVASDREYNLLKKEIGV